MNRKYFTPSLLSSLACVLVVLLALPSAAPGVQAENIASTSASALNWNAPVRVNDDAGSADQKNPALTIGNDGTLYLAWQDKRANDTSDIYFAKSSNGGATWSTNVKVNTIPDVINSEPPSIAVTKDGIVSVAWRCTRNSNSDICAARSTNGGSTWSAGVRVNDDSGTSLQYRPSLVADPSNAGKVYMAWSDERNFYGDIYFSQSSDGGNSWSANTRVTKDNDIAKQPNLKIDTGGRLYLAWSMIDTLYGYVIFYSNSASGGGSWSNAIEATDGKTNIYNSYPDLAIGDNSHIYIARPASYVRHSNTDIFITRSANLGQTWLDSDKINDDTGLNDHANPAVLAFGSGQLLLVWSDVYAGTSKLYSSLSQDYGVSWSVNEAINDTSYAQDAPKLAINISTQTLYMAYQEAHPGLGWDIVITSTPAPQPIPSITVNYPNGEKGSYFRIIASHIPVDRSWEFRVNGHLVDSGIQMSPLGEIDRILSMSNASYGTYSAEIRVNTGAMTSAGVTNDNSASVVFKLQPGSPLRAKEGTAPIITIPVGIALDKYIYLPSLVR